MFKKTTFISICKWVAMIATSIATALATISCSGGMGATDKRIK